MYVVIIYYISYFIYRLHKRTESKRSRGSEKARSPCLNGSIAKSIEIKDISHRKEDSDRVEMAEEVMYSRLHKPHSESTLNQEIHDLCHVKQTHCDVLEQSPCSNFQKECSPTFVKDNTELDSKLTKKIEASDIIAEVHSNSVSNISASESRKDHYSTNTCDSVHVSSIPETRLDHLHSASNNELIPQEGYQSRTCYSLASVKNFENVNSASVMLVKSDNCAEQHLEQNFQKEDSNDGKKNIYDIESNECVWNTEESTSSIRVKSPKNTICAETDTKISPSFCQFDKEFKKSDPSNSASLIKYLMEKKTDKFDRFLSSSINSLVSNELNETNLVKENLNIENANKNEFECRDTVLNHQNDSRIKDDMYIIDVANSSEIKSEIIETSSADTDSRMHPCAENKHFGALATNNANGNVTRNNLESCNSVHKQPVQENEPMSTALRSHKSRKKSLNDKKFTSSGLKEELESVLEHKMTDTVARSVSKTRNKVGKTKNRLTRNQKRDRQKIPTAEIGVADDDSGIQGDIYEFSEKESNLEDVRIPSIMRRSKQETRQTSVLGSHLQEMQCNDECNKTEPPVLIPQEPWPPASCTQSQLVDSDGSTRSRENSIDSESLKR